MSVETAQLNTKWTIEDIITFMTSQKASLWPRKRNASVCGAASALKGFGVST